MSQRAIFAARPHTMRALLEAFVPAAAGLSDGELRRALANSDALVADRPAGMRRQVVLAITVLQVLAFVRNLRGLASLDLQRRRAFLESLQESRLLKFRLAVWGLRTLLFAGYYADPQCHGRIHYRPHPHGWDALSEGDRS